MKSNNEITNFYLSDEYINKNPTLDEEDSPWKVSKIIPFIDQALLELNKKEITLLDVGGGAGLILKDVSKYIAKKGIKVNKISLDLSPGMLKIQKINNSDLKKSLNEDIRKTSLNDKEIDLTLLIDVLEHVPEPEKALKELRRVSKFVIFKVPLDDTITFNISNVISFGNKKRRAKEKLGHINFYTFKNFKRLIEQSSGIIIDYEYTNVFNYFCRNSFYKNKISLGNKFTNRLGIILFRINPWLCSKILNDFIITLVKFDKIKDEKTHGIQS